MIVDPDPRFAPGRAWIQTGSTKFSLEDPHPDEVFLSDIAAALSREPRFGGHGGLNGFHFTVAEHCLYVERLVREKYGDDARTLRLEALLHDAPEAYIKDVMRPLKTLLPDYQVVEHRITDAVRAHWGFPPAAPDDPYGWSPEVRWADDQALYHEAVALFGEDRVSEWGIPKGLPETVLLSSDLHLQPRSAYYAVIRDVEYPARGGSQETLNEASADS